MGMMNTQLRGAITEQKCFLKCLEFGFNVSKPLFDNARYDFILDTGTQLLKIQIKTSHWKDEKHDAFIFNCYSQHSTGNGNKRMKYTDKEIDYFMTEMEGLYYLVPASTDGALQKTLRIIMPNSGQTTHISFASDFLFDEVVKNF